ncbi:MAG: 2-oxoacid:acceptor oxidoreductase subunit alpha [Calditrichaeota bacterium]|nr:2-oxoacid:acceptor oxidoreductase subunit alpha [Calditrichota bacterium]
MNVRDRVFWAGNEIIAEAAVRAGCNFYAGYPITPSSEIAALLSLRLPQLGGVFLQMEDEIAAMGAVVGGSLGGSKAMTATSGPGFSLKQENLGYAIMTETPCVVVDVQRGGPSTGTPTAPAQGDIMQARWGTHGDHTIIALTPGYPVEVYRETVRAFHLSEVYRTPVILLIDEVIAHTTESFEIPTDSELDPVQPRNWYQEKYAENSFRPFFDFYQGKHIHVTGLTHNKAGFATTVPEIVQESIEHLVNKILLKQKDIERNESYMLDDAEIAIITFGSPGRASKVAVDEARKEGIKVGLMRIITFWPFPKDTIRALVDNVKAVIVPEMNMGMLRMEVERAAMRRDVSLHGVNRVGGVPIEPKDVLEKIREVHRGL